MDAQFVFNSAVKCFFIALAECHVYERLKENTSAILLLKPVGQYLIPGERRRENEERELGGGGGLCPV